MMIWLLQLQTRHSVSNSDVYLWSYGLGQHINTKEKVVNYVISTVAKNIPVAIKRLNYISKERFFKRTLQSWAQKYGKLMPLEDENVITENTAQDFILEEVWYVI